MEPAYRDPFQVRLVRDEATTRTAQRVGGPDDQRQTNLSGELTHIVERLAHARDGHRLSDPLEHVLEGLAVLRLANRLDPGAEQPHMVAIEDARGGKLGRQVPSSLAPHGRQQRLRPPPPHTPPY